MIGRAEHGGSPLSIEAVPGVNAVQMPGFLPPAERDALFELSCAHRELFAAPSAPGIEASGSLYLSLESPEGDRPELAPIREATRPLSERILHLLPTLIEALGVEPFEVEEIPLTLVNGLDGHYGLPHADSTDGRWRISLLYYFHRVPRAFAGGGLNFYSADPEAVPADGGEVLAHLEHEDNVLLAFPSQLVHGITPVRCDSAEFGDGRFAVIGFLGPEAGDRAGGIT